MASVLQEKMMQVMGELPSLPPRPPRLAIQGETHDSGLLRRHITFETEAGDHVPAWLLLPVQAARKPGPGPRRLPAVLCLHQTTRIGKDEPAGLGGQPNLHYARELALQGYVTLAPDYPNFGEYRFDPYAHGYASATMKGIVNHRRAVQVLASLTFVDPARLAVCGHSLGGHNALFAAAFEPKLRAVITSCGFTSFARYMGGDLKGWSHSGYMPRIASAYGSDPARMPFEFADVLAAIAPRPIFVNAPEKDANFAARGVDEAVQGSRHPAITVLHPDSGHDFPAEVRQRAWLWLGEVLSRAAR